MTIDRADWHYDGNFPKDLPQENGATHIGMFLAWIILNGLESQEVAEQSSAAIEKLRSRTMTGRQLLLNEYDGKFWESMLSDDGMAFTQAYYLELGDEPYSPYLLDYVEATDGPGVDSAYRVTDSWANYDRVAARIDAAYAFWKSTGKRPYGSATPTPPPEGDETEERASPKDWYRQTEWTAKTKGEFEARLKRCRISNRAEYLRVQGATLQAAGEHAAAAEVYARALTVLQDPGRAAIIHCGMAISLAEVGQIAAAATALRAALQVARDVPGGFPPDWWGFCWVVVNRQLVDLYADIRPLIDRKRDESGSMFEIWCTRAVLAAHRGDRDEARSMAERALNEYRRERELHRYRPRLRELDLRHRSIEARLRSLVAP